MDELTTVSVIHFYVAQLRETLCGLRGFEHRSTKHARGVNCQACVGLLRERAKPHPEDASRAAAAAFATTDGA